MLDLSAKAKGFSESVIREMTRLARAHGAINLAQGFPDFGAPEAIKEAARRNRTSARIHRGRRRLLHGAC